MTAGLLATLGFMAAVVVLARRNEREFERFWRQATEWPRVVAALLEQLAGIERVLRTSEERARALRAAGEENQAARVEEACRAYERSKRDERRRLRRLRRIVGARP